MLEMVAPPRERVIEEAYLAGRLNLPGFDDPDKRRLYYGYVWFGSKRPYLEPVKEASGAEKRLKTGISSLTMECAKQGRSLQSVIQDWSREKRALEKAGLPLPVWLRDVPEPEETPEAPPSDDDETNTYPEDAND